MHSLSKFNANNPLEAYSKSQEKTGFANTGISNKQKLKQIVTAKAQEKIQLPVSGLCFIGIDWNIKGNLKKRKW